MKLTKQALTSVRFRTRGRWYHAGQVDAFLEELLVAVDEAERSMEEHKNIVRTLTKQLEESKEEVSRLQQQAADFQQNAEQAKAALKKEAQAAAERKLLCRELERERDRLIQDICALQDFREEFRTSIQRDADSLTEQIKDLGSDKLL